MRSFIFFLVLGATTASAQSFDELFSAAQQQAGELSKYQEALQNPDLRMQYSLVQNMLGHSDPGVQRIAKEHALFSTNPLMREAGIKAIMDSASTLRMQIAVTSETANGIESWLINNGGVLSNGRGEVLLVVPPPIDNDCWGTRDKCSYKQVSNSLQYNAPRISVVMTLSNDGIMRGNLTFAQNSQRESAQVQVDLKE